MEQNNDKVIFTKKQMNAWLERHADYMDDRKLTMCVNAVTLPNGEWGMVQIFLKDNYLNIYDVHMRSQLGDLLYSVDLKKAEKIKFSGFLMFSAFTVVSNGKKYKFDQFMGAKQFKKGVYESAGIEK